MSKQALQNDPTFHAEFQDRLNKIRSDRYSTIGRNEGEYNVDNLHPDLLIYGGYARLHSYCQGVPHFTG